LWETGISWSQEIVQNTVVVNNKSGISMAFRHEGSPTVVNEKYKLVVRTQAENRNGRHSLAIIHCNAIILLREVNIGTAKISNGQ
jgi:hypothetical protein